MFYQYFFYDCCQVMSLEENLLCIFCVSNCWICQWDLCYYECWEVLFNFEDGIVCVYMEDSCFQFLGFSFLVIFMNYEIDVNFQGKNLDIVKGFFLYVGSDLFKFMELVIMQEFGIFVFWILKLFYDVNEMLFLYFYVKFYGKNIDSKFYVIFYDCFFGCSDCSLCWVVNFDYRCVWCGGQSRCVYEVLCNIIFECLLFVIIRIQFEMGFLGGGICIIVLGFNLGV